MKKKTCIFWLNDKDLLQLEVKFGMEDVKKRNDDWMVGGG